MRKIDTLSDFDDDTTINGNQATTMTKLSIGSSATRTGGRPLKNSKTLDIAHSGVASPLESELNAAGSERKPFEIL